MSQTEKSWTAAMAAPVERMLKKSFCDNATVMCIDLGHHNPGSAVKRSPTPLTDMTGVGREFFARAALASEDRFKTLSSDELVKAMLDFRTLSCADDYLTEEEQTSAATHLEQAYVEYALNSHRFRMQGALPAAAPEQPETLKRKRSVFARQSSVEKPKEGKAVENSLRKSFAREFHVAWTNWTTHAIDIDWCGTYKGQLGHTNNDDIDIVSDLMPLDIGPLYSDLKPALFFKLPMMAKQRLGENMAASFCERMNSIAKDVLDEGHSLLLDAELEALVVLRANREFMKKCRGDWLIEIRLYAETHGLTIVPT